VRVLLSTYDSRGGIEPLLGLAAQLRALGAAVRMCAPPDCAERLAEVGVPLVPVGDPVRSLVHGATPPRPAGEHRRCPHEPRGLAEPGPRPRATSTELMP
jgi:vancomycin aglycone glucosyltransferase